jgi:hypothetical protein
MAKEIINIDNADNSGGDETFTVSTVSTLEQDKTLIQYYNGWDVGADVTITGSRAGDDDFSEGVALVSANTVSSGGSSDFYVVSDPWEQVEILVSPASGPGSGSFTAHRMDDN